MTDTRSRAPRVIYDFGCNNGDDIPYYLKKCDLVVAVEANPILTERIAKRFSDEISDRRLVVVNCVLTTGNEDENVPFYIHKTHDVLSQFPRPDEHVIGEFKTILLPSINVIKLIEKYGYPHYVKTDLEHYDQEILRELFSHDIRPAFISSEAHDIEVFAIMLSLGKYKAFKLVDGPNVHINYKNCLIKTANGQEAHSFPPHSAGPFGEDINEPWMNAENFLKLLAFEGFGWKDIHATNSSEPDPFFRPRLKTYIFRAIEGKISTFIRRCIGK